MKKDNSQTIFNLLSQVVLNGTNFVLIMVYTRFLPTDEYGIVSIYQAYVLFFAAVIGLQTQGSIPPIFVRIKDQEKRNYLSSIMLLSLASLILILCLISIFMDQFVSFSGLSYSLVLLMLFHAFGNFCFNFINIKYVYMRKAQNSFALSVLISALMIIFSYVGITMIKGSVADYVVRILSLSVPYIICFVIVICIIFYRTNPFSNIKEYWSLCLPISIPLIFHAVSQVVLAQTDKIMLEKILQNYTTVGIYSFIVTFVHVLNSVYTALNNTWVPIYYSYLKEGDTKKLLKRSQNYSLFFLNMTLGFLMVSPEFVKIFADSSYWGGLRLIPIVAASIYMTFIYSFAVNYEIYHKETKLIACGTVGAAICNITVNWLLIPKFGMYGAAFATLISYVALLLFHFTCAHYISKKHNECQFSYKMRSFAPYIIVLMVFILIFYAFLDIWYVRWLFATVIGLVIVIRIYKTKTIF